jgi:hypothetical protein
MNPFRAWREMRERSRRRATFAKYLPAEVIAHIEKAPKHFPSAPEPKAFEFIVIQAQDHDPQQLLSTLGRVISTCRAHGAGIPTVMSSLLVAHFGVFFPAPAPDSRTQCVSELLSENGSSIRMVHGRCEGMAGIIGAGKAFTFGSIVPGFSNVLAQLLQTDFGSAKEVP